MTFPWKGDQEVKGGSPDQASGNENIDAERSVTYKEVGGSLKTGSNSSSFMGIIHPSEEFSSKLASSSFHNESRRGRHEISMPANKTKPPHHEQPHAENPQTRLTTNKMSVHNLISVTAPGDLPAMRDLHVPAHRETNSTVGHSNNTTVNKACRPAVAANKELGLKKHMYKSFPGSFSTSHWLTPQAGPSVLGLINGKRKSQTNVPSLPRLSSGFAAGRDKGEEVSGIQSTGMVSSSYATYSAVRNRADDFSYRDVELDGTNISAPVSIQNNQYQPLPSEPKAKRPWTEQEDSLLRSLVEQLGQGLWAAIAAQIPGRSGKQVRERWLNHLSPNVTKRPWSIEEDEVIIESHRRFGNCWSRIAKLLEGRSDNSVKNRFYTTLRRRISAPRACVKRGSPEFSQSTLPIRKKRKSPTVQQPSEQVELMNRRYKQTRVWE